MVVIILHYTLDQLHRANHKRVDKTCKSSILDPVKHTQCVFFHDFFIRLITSINDRVDNRYGYDGIIHSIEERHETLISDDFSELIHHGEIGLELHAYFEGVKNVARYAIPNARETAVEEVDCPVSHRYKFMWPEMI
jgi:hypothetical protein